MIELKLNAEGQLTEEGKEQVQKMMSELAQKCLVVLATLTAEDLRQYNNHMIETENVKNIKTLLEEVTIEADIPAILTSSISGELKLINTLLQNIGHSFINAQNIIALDAMGKKKETEVSVRDIRETYNKIVSKNVQEAVAE